MGCYIKDASEIERMRRAGAIAAQTLEYIAPLVRPGVTLKTLEQRCQEFIEGHKAVPAFLGYRGFPGAVCIGLGPEVVHGIPDRRRVKPGDVVKIDVGVLLDGVYADTARTFLVEPVSDQARRLVQATEEALYIGIEQARSGRRLMDISASIQQHVESSGFSVVRELSGHGVGLQLHEEPAIPNFGKAGTGPQLQAGMTLAIEPMVSLGRPEVNTEPNGWTVVTRDGTISAHFEHTVLVTNGPADILTVCPN